MKTNSKSGRCLCGQKFNFLLFAITMFSNVNAQVNRKYPKTVIYAGYYSIGTDIKKGRVGSVTVYPETDSTILFYVEANRGAPSYNMGQLYGRLTLVNGKGIFYSNPDNAEKSCKFSCTFQSDHLILETIDNEDNCGFGFDVYVDGRFKRKTKNVPHYFEDETGRKVYFKKTPPENWDAP